jgi:hypothetical protein
MSIFNHYVDPFAVYTGKPTFTNASITNFCLAPLSLALNRQINVYNEGTQDNPKLTFVTQNVDNLVIRTLSAFTCIIWSPFIIAGLCGRVFSSAHANLRHQGANYTAHINKATKEVRDAFEQSDFAIKARAYVRNIEEKLDLKLEIQVPNASTLGYEELLKLKRTLRVLAHYDHRFGGKHQKVRQLYYKKFALEHAVRNLKEKGLLSCLERQHKLSYTQETCNEILRSFQSAYQPNFFHGTQSATLAAVMQSDQSLKPAGTLRSEGKLAFNGEAGRGSFGVNEGALSGTQTGCGAITYAYGGIGFHSEVSEACVHSPAEAAKAYGEQFDEWLNTTFNPQSPDTVGHYIYSMDSQETHKTAAPQYLCNFHREMKILWTLAPEEFETHVLPKVQKLNRHLESIRPRLATNPEYSAALERLITKKFAPILTFKGQCPKFSAKEKALIAANFPLVFGASNITYRDEKQVTDIAYQVHERGEYAYRGNLKLGQEITHLFVPQENIQQTKDYLTAKNITNVTVTNIPTLEMVQTLPQLKSKKAQARTYTTAPTTAKLDIF